ncbi:MULTISPECIES: hypothetical protein [unclassified Pseudomonas]|jgi:hypothetical protein|uniref:hypothetical protein n=1 Tax=unclassified Pseudomonas TaxID=196821 RepID=UPI0013202840|nr:hypothetical protein [Pseudomonas sp. R84]QHC95784.1 hypothetical protein PspR84_14415 [Pseudomonas sp. R84]
MRLTGIFLAACLTSGCSVVTVKGAQTQQRFINIGPVNLQTDMPARAIVTSAFGVGATSVQGTNNIGYLNQEVVVIPSPSSCNLILIVRDHKEIENIKRALGETINHVCSNSAEVSP